MLPGGFFFEIPDQIYRLKRLSLSQSAHDSDMPDLAKALEEGNDGGAKGIFWHVQVVDMEWGGFFLVDWGILGGKGRLGWMAYQGNMGGGGGEEEDVMQCVWIRDRLVCIRGLFCSLLLLHGMVAVAVGG